MKLSSLSLPLMRSLFFTTVTSYIYACAGLPRFFSSEKGWQHKYLLCVWYNEAQECVIICISPAFTMGFALNVFLLLYSWAVELMVSKITCIFRITVWEDSWPEKMFMNFRIPNTILILINIFKIIATFFILFYLLQEHLIFYTSESMTQIYYIWLVT